MVEDDTTGKKRVELFLGCTSVSNGGTRSQVTPFAVVFLKQEGNEESLEIARTETCAGTTSPRWCTSIEVDYDEVHIDSTMITFEIYHREQEGVESLSEHRLLGRTVVPLRNIIAAPGMHFLTTLSSNADRGNAGVLHVFAENRSQNKRWDELIEIDVLATPLRKRDWPGKTFLQSFEILRAHMNDDSEGNVVWLPVYRSCRVGKQANKDSSQDLEFSRVTLTAKHFCNGDEERRIRLMLYARSPESGVKKLNNSSKPVDIEVGYVDVTFRDLCEVDPTEEVFEIETAESSDSPEPSGFLSLLKAEPTDVGSHFVVQITHANSRKLSSPSSKRVIVQSLSRRSIRSTRVKAKLSQKPRWKGLQPRKSSNLLGGVTDDVQNALPSKLFNDDNRAGDSLCSDQPSSLPSMTPDSSSVSSKWASCDMEPTSAPSLIETEGRPTRIAASLDDYEAAPPKKRCFTQEVLSGRDDA